MSNTINQSDFKTTPKKGVRHLRRRVREDAIIWTPGDPPPSEVFIYAQNEMRKVINDLEDKHKSNLQQNYIVKHPNNGQDAFAGMLDQIALLDPAEQDRAIAAFMAEVINVRTWRLKQLQKDRERADLNVARAEDQFYNLQKIQRGDFAIVNPVNNSVVSGQMLVAKSANMEKID